MHNIRAQSLYNGPSSQQNLFISVFLFKKTYPYPSRWCEIKLQPNIHLKSREKSTLLKELYHQLKSWPLDEHNERERLIKGFDYQKDSKVLTLKLHPVAHPKTIRHLVTYLLGREATFTFKLKDSAPEGNYLNVYALVNNHADLAAYAFFHHPSLKAIKNAEEESLLSPEALTLDTTHPKRLSSDWDSDTIDDSLFSSLKTQSSPAPTINPLHSAAEPQLTDNLPEAPDGASSLTATSIKNAHNPSEESDHDQLSEADNDTCLTHNSFLFLKNDQTEKDSPHPTPPAEWQTEFECEFKSLSL